MCIDDVFMRDINARINQRPNFIDMNFIMLFFTRFQLTRSSFELKRITAIYLIHD